MLEAVCLVDEKSLAVLAANEAAAKLLGRTVQELVGQSVLGFVATPQDHVFWAQPVDAIADGIHSETSVLHANGALIAVERQLRRVPLPGGGAVSNNIQIVNAKEHNLKNLSVNIPRGSFNVVTGVSGSGKSTLAFDILFNEGQRRYLESLNAYARSIVQPAGRPRTAAPPGYPPMPSPCSSGTAAIRSQIGDQSGNTMKVVTSWQSCGVHLMQNLRRRIWLAAVASGLSVTTALTGLLAATVHAQTPADAPLRIVVGYPPGGSSDRVARIVADKLQAKLGSPVIVENKAGAGGRLSAQYVKAAPVHQPALLLANPAVMVVAPLVFPDAGYDAERDFRAVSHRFVLGYCSGDMTAALFLQKYPSVEPVRGKVSYLKGLMYPNWAAWQIGSIAGVFLGSAVPAEWGLGFAGTLAIICIMVPPPPKAKPAPLVVSPQTVMLPPVLVSAPLVNKPCQFWDLPALPLHAHATCRGLKTANPAYAKT
eukprot:gene35783-44122_t